MREEANTNIIFDLVKSTDDLEAILALQEINLPKSLDESEMDKQGFVTIEHSYELLEKMNVPYPHIIAKVDDQVVGYTLVMCREMQAEIPMLKPMFERINQIKYFDTSLGKSRYVIMGQVCVAKQHRSTGIFAGLYEKMKSEMAPHFEYVITEISTKNKRSMRAHEKVGFEFLQIYTDHEGREWQIVLLRT